MNNEDETTNDGAASPGVVKSTGSKFFELLVSWGVPGVIAAAIIGAAYAVLMMLTDV